MNLPATLDLKTEFNLFKELILKTWNIPNIPEFEVAANDLFNKGLVDARCWMDDITYRIGKIINKNKEIEPLKERQESYFNDNKPALIYDALCSFDYSLSNVMSKISKNQMQSDKWNYSKQTNNIVSYVSKTYPNLKSVEPIQINKQNQKILMKEYKGFKADCINFSDLTYRISYDYTKYSNDEQGRSYFYSLFSAIYTYGLACAKEINNRSLIQHFAPLYLKFRDLPLSMYNGEEIMNESRQHEFMELFEKATKFEFMNSEKEKKSKNTPEVSKKNINTVLEALASSSFKKFDLEEHNKKKEKEEEFLYQLIEDFKQKLSDITI